MKRAGTVVERLAYSPEEGAASLGVGLTKFNELVKSGEIEAVKHKGRVLIPAESLRRFLANLPKVIA